MNRLLRRLLAGSVALAMAGCSTPPPVPLDAKTDLPPSFTTATVTGAPTWPTPDWWMDFRTNELQALEEAAARGNLDIAAAAARVDQAEANARAAFSPLLPNVQGTAGATRSRPNGLPAPDGAGSGAAFSKFTLGFQASYQLDFWGLLRDRLKQARESARAAHYAQSVVGLTVSANVAVEYFTALALRERIAVTRRNIAAAREILAITRAKVDAGVLSNLPLSQEEATVAAQEASLPQLQQAEREARFALALLLGRPPEGFDIAAQNLNGIASPLVAPGLPSELLARRPDIAQAEAILSASHANVDAARASFFPNIGLTGSGAYSSGSLTTLLDPASLGWSIGASLLQTVFDGGKLFAGLDLSKAMQMEMLVEYRKTVFGAFADVEAALGSVVAAQDQLNAAIRQQRAAAEAFRISDVQYRAGTVEIISVLQSQQLLFQADNLLIQSKLWRLQADIALYQALGGGWRQQDQDRMLAAR